MIFVFNPIAVIAQMIKNLLNSFIGLNTEADTPKFVATVVITEAPRKKRMKNGNTFENLKVESFAFSFFDFGVCYDIRERPDFVIFVLDTFCRK